MMKSTHSSQGGLVVLASAWTVCVRYALGILPLCASSTVSVNAPVCRIMMHPQSLDLRRRGVASTIVVRGVNDPDGARNILRTTWGTGVYVALRSSP